MLKAWHVQVMTTTIPSMDAFMISSPVQREALPVHIRYDLSAYNHRAVLQQVWQ